MKKQTVIDPEAVELRRVLGPLQQAVAEGAMTHKQANATLGNVADSLVATRSRKVGKNALFGARYSSTSGTMTGRIPARGFNKYLRRQELVWSDDADKHVLR